MELGQDVDLLDDVVDFVFRIFNVDNLDGNRLTGSLIDSVSTQPTRPHYVSSLAPYSLDYRMDSSETGLELYLPLVDFSETASP